MNLLWKIGLLGMGLGLLAAAAMQLVVVFSLRRFNRMPDTHDLAPRVDQLANGYINKRPQGALALGVLQKDKRFLRGYGRYHCPTHPRATGAIRARFEILKLAVKISLD